MALFSANRLPAHLLLLVQDQAGQALLKCSVQVRSAGGRTWRKAAFDKSLGRFVLRGMAPGPADLRVHGPKGWLADERRVQLHDGPNSLFSSLAPEGTPFYPGPDGERVFFTPDPAAALLYVSGPDVHERLPGLLRESRLAQGKLVVHARQPTYRNQGTYRVALPRGQEQRRRELERLESFAQSVLPKAGLQGRVAIPLGRGEAVDGLTREVAVRLQAAVTREEAAELAKANGFEVVRPVAFVPNGFLWRWTGPLDYDIADACRRLMADPRIVYAEPNTMQDIELDYTPNDFLFPEVPHHLIINTDDAWDTLAAIAPADTARRAGSPAVTIAVFDSNGVDPTHPDLTGNLTDGTAKMAANFDFLNWSNQTFANLAGDHGTQCASSATGRFDNALGVPGVAGNCHLIGAQLPASATGLDLADAWIWAAGFATGSTNASFPAQLPRGADVISNSWGVSNTFPSIVRDALDFLTVYGRGGRGCVVCFSTGNLGHVQFSNVRRYAAYERTIAVGASINSNPTNPCTSAHVDPISSSTTNLPAIVDTRAYYNPFGPEMDIVAPSHTSYATSAGNPLVDPVASAVRVGQGNWTGAATSATTSTAAVAAGANSLPVASTAGFAAGGVALLRSPGAAGREFRSITGVGASSINVAAVQGAHPAGTAVSTGPRDYSRAFGGTSHACPTVAGAAALVLSARPDLTWIEVRQVLRGSAVRIDAAQANATGQWVDNDGDGVAEFSQWYGYGRLDANAAVIQARDLALRADVVVRDNLSDSGAVPSPGWHAHSPDLWTRRTDDPIPTLAYTDAGPHQSPRRGQPNYVYVRVKNVGAAPAASVYVRAMISHYPGFEFQYPRHWTPTNRPGATVATPMPTGTYLIGETRIDNLAPNDVRIVKMTWPSNLVPPEDVTVAGVTTHWHPCMLAEVSPHDGPAPSSTGLDVQKDNNLAQRNIDVLDPSETAVDAAAAVVAGTDDASGVDAVILDRSRLPADYEVFVRCADERRMRQWIELAQAGKLRGVDPLPGSKARPPREAHAEGCCAVTLLDAARIQVACEGGSLRIHAPAGTRLDGLCDCSGGPARPQVGVGTFQGKDVLVHSGGGSTLELPLRLAPGELVPLAIGLRRPEGATGGHLLNATQRRGDGTLSAGYTIQG